MSTFVGRVADKPARVEAAKNEQETEKTRAELAEEAEELGIKITKNMTKAQIQKAIDEAPVM